MNHNYSNSLSLIPHLTMNHHYLVPSYYGFYNSFSSHHYQHHDHEHDLCPISTNYHHFFHSFSYYSSSCSCFQALENTPPSTILLLVFSSLFSNHPFSFLHPLIPTTPISSSSYFSLPFHFHPPNHHSLFFLPSPLFQSNPSHNPSHFHSSSIHHQPSPSHIPQS
ncbi:hypothetical protein MtrunA17_Chr1g0204341 [Medicago truncatula]|uniref:Uncharacterized protein n=1 Tax=Medicago truncatula TaxID=3880 RepID=A0A396K839_MEDTR|nr:hypothetical protein MtrunA17_Chr1g0204341 [Medicago truncatula]